MIGAPLEHDLDQTRAQALLERLSHLLREDVRAVATRHGLALAQLEVLRFLGEANRFSDTLTGMVDYLGATKGTLSQTVSALERKGLVVRVPDADDGRVQHCRLTVTGRAVERASREADTRQVALDHDGVERLERLLTDLLRARGGRAFGVCSSCAHHRSTAEGRHCALLGVRLTDDDAARICREHVAADHHPG